MKFYSDINLNLNQLKNAVIHIVASDGAIVAPVEGQIIYASNESLIKYYDGVQWVAINEFTLQVSGDTGSAEILRDETLEFAGGVNITTVVTSDNIVTFNLDPSITLASDITVPGIFAQTIYATDVSIADLDVTVVDAGTISVDTLYATDASITDLDVTVVDAGTISVDTLYATDASITDLDVTVVDAGTISVDTLYATDATITSLEATTVESTNVFTSNVVATDITTSEIYAGTGSIGTAIFGSDSLTVTSSVVIGSDLIVNGSIVGDISTSDVTGLIYTFEADDENDFPVNIGDTVVFEGTANEIETSVPSAGTIKIGIVTNPTLSGDVTITGDLTVQGTTTTIDSQTLTVRDPLIELNTGIGNSNTNDLGLLMMRGASDVGFNVGFVWKESNDTFALVSTLDNASDTTITIEDYLPITVGSAIVSSDLNIGGKIVEYQGAVPSTGDILIGSSAGFVKGQITGDTASGAVVTSSTDSIVVSLDIDGATDGTGITVVSTDQLLLSDGGVEKRIHVGQLGSVFVRHDTAQSLSASDTQRARQNISAAEIVTATITTGDGTVKTFYIEHGIGSTDVLVQIFDNNGLQVFADVDTTVGTGGNLGNFISVTGNLTSGTYTVRIVGTRGTPLTGTTSEVAPS